MTPENFVETVFERSKLLPSRRVLVYGEKVSDHLVQGVDHVTSPDTGQVVLLPELVDLFESARQLFGGPLRVNAGFRTVAHEMRLQDAGYKTAAFVSPHCLGCALDVQAAQSNGFHHEVNSRLQKAIRNAALTLHLPAPRLGHFAYGETFTHVDLVFLLFEPYTHLPHPRKWPELTPETQRELQNWETAISW